MEGKKQLRNGSSFHMDHSKFTKEGKPSRWRYLHYLIAFLMTTTVTFAILFAVYYMKYDYASKEENETNNKVIHNEPMLMVNQSASKNMGINVCTSTSCVATAGYLLTKMDLTADPCQDYHQFVCGQVNKGPYKDDVEDSMREERDLFLLTLLDEYIEPDDLEFVKKMKQIFRLCLDTDTIEQRGVRSYKTSRYPSHWPTLNSAWNSSAFSLNDLLVEYEHLTEFGLFSYSMIIDPTQPSKYIIQFNAPDLCVYRERTGVLRACQEYYVSVSSTLGADRVTSHFDGRSDTFFQWELKTNLPDEETRKKTSLEQMSKDYPSIDWHRVMQASFRSSGINIPLNTKVLVQYPEYFAALEKLLNNTDPRIIANKLAFAHANVQVKDLTEDLRDASKELSETEDTEKEPQWRCLTRVKEELGTGLSKMFIDRTFSTKANRYVTNMTVLIEETFGDQLESLTWMGNATKLAALQKLRAMKFRIGFPSQNIGDDDVNRLYENLTVTENDLYASWLSLRELNKVNYQRFLTRQVDNSNWQEDAMYATGEYNYDDNQISIFAGILQPGEFSLANPGSVSFGSPGWLIGHEISHGFDNRGSKYDANGDLRDWWTQEDSKNFKEKYQCLIDQYSKFHVKEINGYVDGKNTVSENIGDNGGLNVAYKAYKKFSATHPQELPLPGLGLTTDQQFFVGAAQKFCNKKSGDQYQEQIEHDVHAPEKFRIIGSAMNSEDFAKAFHCPQGSPMNPAKKCVVW